MGLLGKSITQRYTTDIQKCVAQTKILRRMITSITLILVIAKYNITPYVFAMLAVTIIPDMMFLDLLHKVMKSEKKDEKV